MVSCELFQQWMWTAGILGIYRKQWCDRWGSGRGRWRNLSSSGITGKRGDNYDLYRYRCNLSTDKKESVNDLQFPFGYRISESSKNNLILQWGFYVWDFTAKPWDSTCVSQGNPAEIRNYDSAVNCNCSTGSNFFRR